MSDDVVMTYAVTFKLLFLSKVDTGVSKFEFSLYRQNIRIILVVWAYTKANRIYYCLCNDRSLFQTLGIFALLPILIMANRH